MFFEKRRERRNLDVLREKAEGAISGITMPQLREIARDVYISDMECEAELRKGFEALDALASKCNRVINKKRRLHKKALKKCGKGRDNTGITLRMQRKDRKGGESYLHIKHAVEEITTMIGKIKTPHTADRYRYSLIGRLSRLNPGWLIDYESTVSGILLRVYDNDMRDDACSLLVPIYLEGYSTRTYGDKFKVVSHFLDTISDRHRSDDAYGAALRYMLNDDQGRWFESFGPYSLFEIYKNLGSHTTDKEVADMMVYHIFGILSSSGWDLWYNTSKRPEWIGRVESIGITKEEIAGYDLKDKDHFARLDLYKNIAKRLAERMHDEKYVGMLYDHFVGELLEHGLPENRERFNAGFDAIFEGLSKISDQHRLGMRISEVLDSEYVSAGAQYDRGRIDALWKAIDGMSDVREASAARKSLVEKVVYAAFNGNIDFAYAEGVVGRMPDEDMDDRAMYLSLLAKNQGNELYKGTFREIEGSDPLSDPGT